MRAGAAWWWPRGRVGDCMVAYSGYVPPAARGWVTWGSYLTSAPPGTRAGLAQTAAACREPPGPCVPAGDVVPFLECLLRTRSWLCPWWNSSANAQTQADAPVNAGCWGLRLHLALLPANLATWGIELPL